MILRKIAEEKHYLLGSTKRVFMLSDLVKIVRLKPSREAGFFCGQYFELLKAKTRQ